MTLYDNRGTLWIGFHGCDRSVRDRLLSHPFNVRISNESYDWLGSGFYVWENNDLILRNLDCAVINYLCNEAENKIDTARGVFIEGGPVYKGGKIYEKTHIQVCIKNLDCIKGFLMPKA